MKIPLPESLTGNSVVLSEFAGSDRESTSAALACRPISRRYDVAPGTVVQENVTGRSAKFAGTGSDGPPWIVDTDSTGAVSGIVVGPLPGAMSRRCSNP